MNSEHAALDEIRAGLRARRDAVITVRVRPNASRTAFLGAAADGSWRIAVAAPPEGGRANEELVRFLRRETAARTVEILRGHGARTKVVRLRS
jgi:uncharacterized protein (TIGR00251 family)